MHVSGCARACVCVIHLQAFQFNFLFSLNIFCMHLIFQDKNFAISHINKQDNNTVIVFPVAPRKDTGSLWESGFNFHFPGLLCAHLTAWQHLCHVYEPWQTGGWVLRAHPPPNSSPGSFSAYVDCHSRHSTVYPPHRGRLVPPRWGGLVRESVAVGTLRRGKYGYLEV